MPTVPSADEETICEVNRDFVTVKAQIKDVLDIAQERYSRILGRVFPRVNLSAKAPLKPSPWSGIDENPDNAAAAAEEIVQDAPRASILQKIEEFLFKKRPLASSKAVQSRGISWHKQKLYLAVVAGHQVFVVDYEELDVKEPYLLNHDLQQNPRAVEWRPNSGSMLAVGCWGGICVWLYSTRPLTSSTLGASPPRAGTRWTQVDFLHCRDDSISSLSWSPCGRLLAAGSLDNATFSVWDVSIGESTPLRRGLAGVQFLKWSPLGDYLLSAKVDSSFYLWETSTWTSEPWSASGGTMVNAAWSPEGKMLLCGFDQSTTLGTLHFAGKPPSLEIHLLPLELREIEMVAGPGGAIEMIAWDGTGERLAVSYNNGDAVYAGLVAVFDTRRTPITSASLLGFIRGPGQGVKPLSFAFLDKLRQGALLAVNWSSGTLCVYPLLFRTH